GRDRSRRTSGRDRVEPRAVEPRALAVDHDPTQAREPGGDPRLDRADRGFGALGDLAGREPLEVGELEGLALERVELGEGLEHQPTIGRALKLVVGGLADQRGAQPGLTLAEADLIGAESI